jgi:hypothetical protein
VDEFIYWFAGAFFGYAIRPFFDVAALLFANATKKYLADREKNK